jgi:long-chain fatty acid transport protein
LLSTAAIGVLAATPAAAGGFNLDHQNAAALGMAFAGAQARTGDAGYAAYNPAAIASLERAELSASVTGIFPSVSYSDAAATLLGVAPVAGRAADGGVIDDAVVPNLSIAAPLTDRLAVGLVVNATFGFTTDFAADSIVRYQAQRSDLTVLEAAPTVAFEISPAVRIGASLRIQRMDLLLTSVIDAGGIAAASSIPGFAPGSSDLPAAFDVDDIAIGYAVGLQADLTPRLHAGFAYSSKIDHDLEGAATFDLGASAAGQVLNGAVGLFAADGFTSAFSTPATAALGAELEVTERFSLLASARVMFWSSFENVVLDFNDLATPDEILTQNWKDSVMASVGAEYAVSEDTTLRAGFMFDESPVNGEFASPRIPDGDRYWLAAGLTQNFGERLSADIGAAYAFFSDRPINLDSAAPEELFRGALTANFETEVFAASLRIRYKF